MRLLYLSCNLNGIDKKTRECIVTSARVIGQLLATEAHRLGPHLIALVTNKHWRHGALAVLLVLRDGRGQGLLAGGAVVDQVGDHLAGRIRRQRQVHAVEAGHGTCEDAGGCVVVAADVVDDVRELYDVTDVVDRARFGVSRKADRIEANGNVLC